MKMTNGVYKDEPHNCARAEAAFSALRIIRIKMAEVIRRYPEADPAILAWDTIEFIENEMEKLN